jgi:hypothetical protein
MAQNHAGFIAKIAVFHVQVGMAYATALHFQQRLSMLQGTQCFFRHINLMIVGNNGCLHVYSLNFEEKMGVYS